MSRLLSELFLRYFEKGQRKKSAATSNKVITTMVVICHVLDPSTTPHDDVLKYVFADLQLLGLGYVGVGDGPFRYLAHGLLLAPIDT